MPASEHRDGQPVIDATIEEINSTPEFWDSKWVRVTGVTSDSGQRLYTKQEAANYPIDDRSHSIRDGHELYLNPTDVDREDEEAIRRDPPNFPAQVTGRVQIVCSEFWQPYFDLIADAAENKQILLVHPKAPENISHCQAISGPYLEDAQIHRLPKEN